MTNFFVYFILFFFTIYCSNRARLTNNIWSSYRIYIAILVYGLVLGLRWNVGKDFLAYYDLITGQLSDVVFSRIEFLPRELMVIIQDFHLPFYTWFIIMAIVQILFLYISVNRVSKKLLPWCTFFFLCLFLDHSLNIVRQCTALTVILCLFTFVEEKKYIVVIILSLVAFFIHHSSIVALPLIFLTYYNKILSTKYQLLIFTLSIFLGKIILPVFLERISYFTALIGYDSAMEAVMGQDKTNEEGSGILVLFNFVLYYFIIFNSKKIYESYGEYISNKNYSLYYNLFFIGICSYAATMYDTFLSRLFMYFTIVSVIIIPSTLYICIKKRGATMILSIGFILVYVLLQFYKMLSSAEWTFIWNINL